MELKISALFVSILLILMALSLLPSLALQTTEATTLYTTSNELHNATYSQDPANFSFTLGNVHLGIDSITNIQNSTNTLTAATTLGACGLTQYFISTSDGNLTVCNYNLSDGGSEDQFNVSYRYKPLGYVDSALGQTMVGLVMLVVGAGFVIWVLRRFFGGS